MIIVGRGKSRPQSDERALPSVNFVVANDWIDCKYLRVIYYIFRGYTVEWIVAGTVDYSWCGELITSKINSITVRVVRDNQMWLVRMADKTVNRCDVIWFLNTRFLRNRNYLLQIFFFLNLFRDLFIGWLEFLNNKSEMITRRKEYVKRRIGTEGFLKLYIYKKNIFETRQLGFKFV